MSRRTLAAVIAICFGLLVGSLWTSKALADTGHGGWSVTTDMCANCHRAHTADESKLVMADSIYDLCMNCHGTGAAPNVALGTRSITVGGKKVTAILNGGGFSKINGTYVTSLHRVAGAPVGSTGLKYEGMDTAWGAASSGLGVTALLRCTSCHNPHGTNNYRSLRDTNNDVPLGPENAWKHRWGWDDSMTDPSQIETLDWQDYQVVPIDDPVGSDTYASYAGNPLLPFANYTAGMRDFCSTCHKSYLTRSGSAKHPSTDSTYYAYPGVQDIGDGRGDMARFRHTTSMTYAGTPVVPLRLATSGPSWPEDTIRDQVVCTTCHYAHGSTASATGYAAGIGPSNDSALLVYDNRMVCQSCHNKQ